MSKTASGASAPASLHNEGFHPESQTGTAKRYLRPKAAGDRTNLSPSTLAKMRMRGDGPPYSKAGPRLVIYDIEDLDQWLESRKRLSTSEAA